jgi:hypothetical protein
VFFEPVSESLLRLDKMVNDGKKHVRNGEIDKAVPLYLEAQRLAGYLSVEFEKMRDDAKSVVDDLTAIYGPFKD